jgi:hypothetical protein
VQRARREAIAANRAKYLRRYPVLIFIEQINDAGQTADAIRDFAE